MTHKWLSMKRNKVVVFDLDDTLYKEIDYLKSAYKEIARWLEAEYGLAGVYEFMISSYLRQENVFQSVNRTYGLEISLEEYLHKYRYHLPTLSLSDDVKGLLTHLAQYKVTMGILTDGRTVTQLNKIKALGLNRYILWENCVISEQIGYSKPSEEGYLFFQRKYVEADFCYIGDNVQKDFIAPNKLGWVTVCLKDNGLNIHKSRIASKEQCAHFEVPVLSEVRYLPFFGD